MLPPPPPQPASSKSSRAPFPSAALQSALVSSLTTGTFADTVYYLYSSRTSGTKIGKPRAVYANSNVLKAEGEYFVAQLAGGFDTNQCLEGETDVYAFENDSDIEDPEESEEHNDTDSDIEDSSEESDDEEHNEDEAELESRDNEVSTGDPSTVKDTEEEETRNLDKNTENSIAISDIAFTTWQALMYYVYTGEVYFAPLRSQGISYRIKAIKTHTKSNPNQPICSPKSMYRVADIVGLDELKNHARRDIRRKISTQTIVDETFSYFSSLYSEILDMQINYLYDKDMISQVIPAMQQKLRDAVDIGVPQVINVVGAIILKVSILLAKQQSEATRAANAGNGVAALSTERPVNRIGNTSSSGVTQKKASNVPRPSSVYSHTIMFHPMIRSALAVSLTTGQFSDTAYYLYSRRLSNGMIGVPRVIYCHGGIIGLNHGATKRVKSKTNAYKYEDDSDIEDAEEEDEASIAPCDISKMSTDVTSLKKHKVVQITDVAARTWEAFMCWIYTGDVDFKPLISWDHLADTSTITKLQCDKREARQPTSCSPKSMYRVTKACGPVALKQRAQSEIERQLRLSEQIVVDEVFSSFSSMHPDIMKMELDILCKDDTMVKMMPAIQKKLEEIAGGRARHTENVLGVLFARYADLLASQARA